jgi:rhamnulokinase
MKEFEQSRAAHVAVDLGASSGRLILGKVQSGHLELSEIVRFSTPVVQGDGEKYQCWDLDAVESFIREGLRACLDREPVESVGVDSWAVDYVLLDAEKKRISQAVCYRDKRTEGIMERIHQRVSAPEIYRRTGIQFQRFNTLYQLAACAEQEPAWLERTAHVAMIPDYLHYQLGGVLANEYTNATTTQMLDISGAWDAELLQAAGLRAAMLLPPVAAGSKVGEMLLGNATIKVVAPATHDTASAVAGAPFQTQDEAFISSGTWSLMGIESFTPFVSEEAMRMNFTNEGGVERRFRVLKNIMGMWPLQRICDENNILHVGRLVETASHIQGWPSIVNLDDEVFLNPRSMVDTIRQYCIDTNQIVPMTHAELARSIFNSLALSYRNVKQQLEELRKRSLTRIRIIGGGSQNRLLNQLCADACQLPISAGPVEASVLGNICVQMIALGEIENLDAARALIRESFPVCDFEPQAEVPANVWRRFQSLLNYKFKTKESERFAQ